MFSHCIVFAAKPPDPGRQSVVRSRDPGSSPARGALRSRGRPARPRLARGPQVPLPTAAGSKALGAGAPSASPRPA